MRFLATLLAGAAAFGISLVFITEVLPSTPAERAEAVSEAPDSWESARSNLAELRRIASQSCSFLTESDGSPPDVFVEQFRAAASAYRETLSAPSPAGEARPADLPLAAPGLDELHQQICPGMIPSEAVAAPAEATLTATPLAGMDFAGLYGAQYLTLAQADAAAYLAGWPMSPGWWPEMRLIIQCESGLNIFAYNGSDPNGGSYGLAQLNGSQHFDRAGENFEYRFDPIVNLRTALWLRTVRGHFGGTGGWKTCSELYGIS